MSMKKERGYLLMTLKYSLTLRTHWKPRSAGFQAILVKEMPLSAVPKPDQLS